MNMNSSDLGSGIWDPGKAIKDTRAHALTVYTHVYVPRATPVYAYVDLRTYVRL